MSYKVSIIIPVYNRESLVPYTLESIKEQSYTDFECLLIDDGSSDNTVDVIRDLIKTDSRFKLFERPSEYRKGPAGCRNYGLDKAEGEYIQFFDSDDLMSKEHLALKVDGYLQNTDLVVCQLSEFKNDDFTSHYGTSFIDDQNDFSKHITGEVNYYLPGPMWKKETIGDDRFSTDIKIYEDLLFNLMNRRKCKTVTLINKPLIFYRRHDETTTAQVNQDIGLLNQKRIAWEKIDRVLMEELNDEKQRLSVKAALFKYSCLNFYYFLCQKSFISSIKQFIDILGYASSKRDLFIAIKLLMVSFVPFVTCKGYKVYKVDF